MRALILGASGQVGAQLAYRCRADGVHWVGTACHHPRFGLFSLDIRDADAVRSLIAGYRPEVVFLPAAMTHVDRAEVETALCRSVNVEGTGHAARAVRHYGGRLVFFSTEHVFGECSRPMHEDDLVAPVSEYAKSKVEAESLVRDLLPDRHLILRASWVYGPDEQEKNFVYRTIATLGAGKALTVASDQMGQPTYGPDLARAAMELARRRAIGTFHVVGPDLCSRLEHARRIARIFELDDDLILGRPTAELGLPAPRPLHVELDRKKLLRVLGHDPIRDPETALETMRDTILSKSPRELAVA